jgi:hypothetical protein
MLEFWVTRHGRDVRRIGLLAVILAMGMTTDAQSQSVETLAPGERVRYRTGAKWFGLRPGWVDGEFVTATSDSLILRLTATGERAAVPFARLRALQARRSETVRSLAPGAEGEAAMWGAIFGALTGCAATSAFGSDCGSGAVGGALVGITYGFVSARMDRRKSGTLRARWVTVAVPTRASAQYARRNDRDEGGPLSGWRVHMLPSRFPSANAYARPPLRPAPLGGVLLR